MTAGLAVATLESFVEFWSADLTVGISAGSSLGAVDFDATTGAGFPICCKIDFVDAVAILAGTTAARG